MKGESKYWLEGLLWERASTFSGHSRRVEKRKVSSSFFLGEKVPTGNGVNVASQHAT